MNAGRHAKWFCGGCVNKSWMTPPRDLVACPNCCGWKPAPKEVKR